jgi:hypothetical protein
MLATSIELVVVALAAVDELLVVGADDVMTDEVFTPEFAILLALVVDMINYPDLRVNLYTSLIEICKKHATNVACFRLFDSLNHY